MEGWEELAVLTHYCSFVNASLQNLKRKYQWLHDMIKNLDLKLVFGLAILCDAAVFLKKKYWYEIYHQCFSMLHFIAILSKWIEAFCANLLYARINSYIISSWAWIFLFHTSPNTWSWYRFYCMAAIIIRVYNQLQ